MIKSIKFLAIASVLASSAVFASEPSVDMIEITPAGGIVTTLTNENGENVVMTPVVIERNNATGAERVTPLFADNGLGYSLALLYGTPTGLTVSAGIIYGLRSDEDASAIRGILVEGSAGTGGGTVAVGLVTAQGGQGSGYSLTLTRLWGNPIMGAADQTYIGVKYEWSLLIKISTGLMYRVAGPDVGNHLVATFSAGIGLSDLIHRNRRRSGS